MNTILDWLNADSHDTCIILKRDGVFPFLSWADMTRAQPPLLTLRSCAWLLVLAAGLPVIFY